MRRGSLTWVALTVAMIAAAGAVYFWRENVDLRQRIATLAATAATGAPAALQRPALRIGMAVPAIAARDTEGHEVRVAAPGEARTLLFIFEPGCPRCEATLPKWTEVFDRLGSLGAKTRVFGLSTGPSYETVEYARGHGLPFPVVPFPSDDVRQLYGVVEVPLTVVVSAEGRVEAFWDKPLSQGEAADVVETACPECL